MKSRKYSKDETDYKDEIYDEDDIYSEEKINDLIEFDEISDEEAGFMMGYLSEE